MSKLIEGCPDKILDLAGPLSFCVEGLLTGENRERIFLSTLGVLY